MYMESKSYITSFIVHVQIRPFSDSYLSGKMKKEEVFSSSTSGHLPSEQKKQIINSLVTCLGWKYILDIHKTVQVICSLAYFVNGIYTPNRNADQHIAAPFVMYAASQTVEYNFKHQNLMFEI